jgi:hypothetical protein
MKNRKILLLLTPAVILISCAYIYSSYKKTYSCSVNGEFFQYKDGKSLVDTKTDGKSITFDLDYYNYWPKFVITDPDNYFPAHQKSQITLEEKKSSSIEKVFLYDQINQETKFRTVTSLILNTTSGDIVMYHHYWIPPDKWQDSDLYTYSGFCLPKKR